MLALIGMAGISHATTWYVSPTGNNSSGNGSSGSPWATLSTACSKVTTAGDSISLAAGNYTDNSTCNLNAGVNIVGAGSGSTKITSSYSGGYYINLVYSPAMNGGGTSNGNQKISGFTLDGNNKALTSGIRVIGYNRVTLNDLILKRIHHRAVTLEGQDNWANLGNENVPPPYYGQYNTVSNVTITGCSYGTSGDYSNPAFWVQSQQYMTMDKVNIDETPATTGGSGNAIKSWPGFINASVIRNCSFRVGTSNSIGDPISLEVWNWENGTEVSNCGFYEGFVSLVAGHKRTASRALIWHDNTMINSVPYGAGHEFSLSDAEYYNNYIEKETVGFWVASHSYNMTGMNNIFFHNNIVFNAKNNSVTVMNSPANIAISGMKIYNNTFDTTDGSWPAGGITFNVGKGLSGLDIRNNLFMNFPSGNGIFFYGGTTSSPIVSNNSFNNSGQISGSASGLSASSNASVNPQINGTGSKYPYASGTYYQLKGGSPLIDVGVNLGLPYNGSAPDIGAFESGGSKLILSAPVLTVQ
jgi:hypothetical protein